jgi:glycine cleavage system H protein
VQIGGCAFPDDRMYDAEGFTWVKTYRDSYTLGITQLQSFNVGKVNSVIPKQPGIGLSAGRSVAYLESSKYSGNVRVPLSGVLLEVNKELTLNPSLVNVDPYQNGWVARLKLVNGAGEDTLLFDADSICGHVERYVNERGIRCFSVYPSFSVSGIGGDCPETLKALGDSLEAAGEGDSALLVTDNPQAEKDVPNWTSAHGFRIIETRFETPIRYYVVGRLPAT